jgi:hypothetical protein
MKPGMPAAVPSDALELLTKGDIRPLGLMPRASNYTFLAEVGEGDRMVLAVYKPRRGETPLWDFPEGTLCNREVAAYELSRALGWPAVPPTVLRKGPMGEGSLQLYVEADPREHFFTLREAGLDAFMPVATFDVVTNNADRKSGHCLCSEDGTIWVVDHGVCFSEEPKLRTVIWEFAGRRVPDHYVEDVRRVAGDLRSGALRDTLLDLLSAGEVNATARRAEALARAGRFPAPGHGRAYPWPPV